MKIVVSIPKPPKESGRERLWISVVSDVNKAIKDGQHQGGEILGEGSWMIVSDSGLPILGFVLHAAEAEKLSHQVLFSDSGTEWKRAF
ncbi:MAG: hypothetical protein IH623_28870 [Verrucomicrobia bacterium]|nr:hypothetical protein [Verrucomicrobiota bacterium]